MSKRIRKAGSHTPDASDKHQSSVDQPDGPARAPISYIGVLIGITLIVGGVWMFLDPSEIRVEHHRLRFLPTVAEYITLGSSQFYGVAGALLGILVLVFATYSPRR